MAKKCNFHNTDYRTNKPRKLVKVTNTEVIIWDAPNQCRVYKQLVLPFKLT